MGNSNKAKSISDGYIKPILISRTGLQGNKEQKVKKLP